MSNGNIDKLYKKKLKPSIGEEDALYFIGDNTSEYIDFYITDKKGNLIPIVDNSRFQNTGTNSDLKLLNYVSDIMDIGTDYFYGYEYEDNLFKIIKVEKGNAVNQLKAINIIGDFNTNWNNRLNLTYN